MKYNKVIIVAFILAILNVSTNVLANEELKLSPKMHSSVNKMAKYFGLKPSDYIILSSKVMSRLNGYNDSPLPSLHSNPTYILLMDKFNSGLALDKYELNELERIRTNSEQALLTSFGIAKDKLTLGKLNEVVSYLLLYRKSNSIASNTNDVSSYSFSGEDEEDEIEVIVVTPEIISQYEAGFGDVSVYIWQQASNLSGYQNGAYATSFIVKFTGSGNNTATQQRWLIYSNGTVAEAGPIIACSEGGVCNPV
ncbi:hypothetical protein [Thalassotalea sediminis]|uniref:hypothetical protein n=1 Tax=Thalassotalea sediminis TaxID=1759089 RepID=UPI0025726F0C|nr:hypothetical protein [Thalassotalea sediminis]